MESVRRTERAEMLGALKPANKALLATIAGQLATSVSPDYGAAAKRLDSALSATESQAVLHAAQNARTQERSIMESMRSQFPPPPNAPHFGMNGPGGPRSGGPHHRTPDAGRMLLGLMGGGPMRMGPPGMHGGPSRR